jgi:formyl-CoA transferase
MERLTHRTTAGTTPAPTRDFPFRKGWLSIDRFSPCTNAVMIAVIDPTI